MKVMEHRVQRRLSRRVKTARAVVSHGSELCFVKRPIATLLRGAYKVVGRTDQLARTYVPRS